jgi:hypothetical protein
VAYNYIGGIARESVINLGFRTTIGGTSPSI